MRRLLLVAYTVFAPAYVRAYRLLDRGHLELRVLRSRMGGRSRTARYSPGSVCVDDAGRCVRAERGLATGGAERLRIGSVHSTTRVKRTTRY